MRRKQNNAGFSLIEVILSMAILAIISIPLLSYFTESMKYNAQMADKQHATTLAQEVLEDLKNQDVLLKGSGTAKTIPYLLGRGYVADASNNLGDADGTGNFIGGTGVFYGAADAIHEKYDVVVTAQSSTAENTKEIPEISGVDDKWDLLALENGQYEEALTHFCAANSAAGTSGITNDKIPEKMERTIGIDIQKDGVYYDVRVSCTYKCTGLSGVDSVDTYECTDYEEERLQDVKHIYILYNANLRNQTDTVVITKGIGALALDPKLALICQNIADIDATYSVNVTGINGSSVITNLGNNGKGGKVCDQMGVPFTDTNGLVQDKRQIRKITLQVSVFKKGEGNTSGAEPYITVNAAKGE